MPFHFGTDVEYGCPYDCGLCVDHEQHSCLSIVEVTDRCNLTCPTCYAMSSPHYGSHRSLEEIEAMFDVIVKMKGNQTWCRSVERTYNPSGIFQNYGYCQIKTDQTSDAEHQRNQNSQ